MIDAATKLTNPPPGGSAFRKKEAALFLDTNASLKTKKSDKNTKIS